MRVPRILVAAAAAAALAALVIGVPVMLLAFVGNPLPDWSTIQSGSLDDITVVKLLACVVWIAWLQWLPGTLLEIAAAGKVHRDPSLAAAGTVTTRHISAGQGLSRTLIAAVMGTAIAGVLITNTARAVATTPAASPAAAPAVSTQVAGSTPLTPAATASAAHGWSVHSDAPHAGQQRKLPVYVVGSDPAVGSTLWSIAEHTMGNPLRWHEIWDLNRGSSQPGGAVFNNPSDIQNGWQLRLPADAVVPTPSAGGPVTVEAGDTLTEIATEHDSTEPAVWARNEGRVMSDRRVFSNPNLIKPGDTIYIPGPTPTTPTHAAPTHPAPPTRSTPATPKTPPRTEPGQTRTGPPATGPTAQPTGQPTAPATPATPSAPQHGEPAHQQPPAHSRPARRHSSDLPMVAFRDGGGLLLAGISLLALMGYTRRQFRNRRPGRAISSCSPEGLRVERTLQSIGGPAMADVIWLDQTLRGLAHGLHDAEPVASRLPDVVAARLSKDHLELILAAAQPNAPEPWVADETGTRWSIARDDESGYDPAQRAYHFAPFPTLTSVGYAEDGAQWLLDLERIGSMSLAGDRERCLDLARFLACELAHNTWSEMLQVTLVGFGSELAEVNPDRLTYTDDFDAAIAELGDQVHSVEDSLRETGRGVLDVREGTGDVWAPHVVLVAPSAARDTDGLARLLATMRSQRTRMAVALVLSDDPEHAGATTWTLTVDEDGALHVPALGLDLRAQQVPAEEAAEFAQHLAQAARPGDRPMPPPTGSNPWDRYADAAGALRVPAESAAAAGAGPADVPVLHLAESSPWMTNSVLPLPRETYLERAATTAEDLVELAPETNDEIREEVEANVGDLDADLAEWYSQTTTRPRVSVLGPVKVRAQGPLPARNPRTQWHTEIVAYLATRPSGVSSEQYATDLWPNDPDPDLASKSKVRQSAMIVRKWLGKNPATGVDYLPPAMAPGFASYRIENCLLDAELFRRLRLRGLARGKDGIEDLWAALRLVTGEPFSERRPEGYAWLADNPLHHIYAAAIVDVAHTVATHHLGVGEPERAAAAAQVALDAGSKEDAPLLDQVAACDAQDRRLEAEEFIRRIFANHGDEEEEIPPRTLQVLRRRQYLDPAS